jgi:hypothetical protein
MPTAASEDDTRNGTLVDDRTVCGGGLRPIREASNRLEDTEWCRQAEYIAGLRTAVEEWKRRTDETGGELPWLDEEGAVNRG